ACLLLRDRTHSKFRCRSLCSSWAQLPPRSTLFPYTTLFRSHRRIDLLEVELRHLVDGQPLRKPMLPHVPVRLLARLLARRGELRSEEHTSELQSRENLVCRLLLEKKNYPKESK